MNISKIISADAEPIIDIGHGNWNAQATALFQAAIPELRLVTLENVANKAGWLSGHCNRLDFWLSYTPDSCQESGMAFLHGKNCAVHIRWYTFTGETERIFVISVENPSFKTFCQINRGLAHDMMFVIDGHQLRGTFVIDRLFKGQENT